MSALVTSSWPNFLTWCLIAQLAEEEEDAEWADRAIDDRTQRYPAELHVRQSGILGKHCHDS